MLKTNDTFKNKEPLFSKVNGKLTGRYYQDSYGWWYEVKGPGAPLFYIKGPDIANMVKLYKNLDIRN